MQSEAEYSYGLERWPRLFFRPLHTVGDSRYGDKRRRQASAQAERQIHATNVCTRTLATHTQQFSKSSKWLHPASLSLKTIICNCFAVGIYVAMLKSEEKVGKRRGTVWSWISFKISSLLRSVIFDGSIRGRNSSPLLLL